MPSNPIPTVTSVSPTSATGNTAVPLTIVGTNFVPSSVVHFVMPNGVNRALATHYVSATEVTATIPAVDMTIAGSASILVHNNRPVGGNSNSVSFTVIGNPLPVVTSLNPLQSLIGAAFTLTVNGSGFIPQSVVHFGSAALATTYVSANQLTAVVPASALEQRIGAKSVFVQNPKPAGGKSNIKVFVVYGNLIKVISSLLNYDFTLTITGDAATDAVVIPANVVNFDLGAVLDGADLNSIQEELEKLVAAGDIVVVSTAPQITYDIEAAGIDPVTTTPLFPSYTTSQKLALANAVPGMTVFDTTLDALSVCTALVSSGNITEWAVPDGGSPFYICNGPDNNLWYTHNLADFIGTFNPTTLIFTEYPVLSSTAGLAGICVGSDNNLWFAEYNVNKIGRITTAGVVTEFPVTTASAGPYGICAGPDGNLWFCETSANQIGRITTAGVVTEFPLISANAQPIGICAGPDGNLWFVEYSSNNIGRITPSGVVTEFAIPTANASPYGICLGPDGNLWFTEQGTNQLAKCTPAGVITEYPIPTGGSGPAGICAGANNTIWFVEIYGNNVASATTAGVITEYPIPNSSSYPYGICVGSDNNMWYTEYESDALGRLSIAPTPVPTWSTLQTSASLSSQSLTVTGASRLDNGAITTDGSGNLTLNVAGTTLSAPYLAVGNANGLGTPGVFINGGLAGSNLPAVFLGQGTVTCGLFGNFMFLSDPGDLSSLISSGFASAVNVEIKTSVNQTYTIPSPTSGGWIINIGHTSDSTVGTSLTVNGFVIPIGKFSTFVFSQRTGVWYVRA